MIPAPDHQTLASYIPPLVVRHFATDPTALTAPTVERLTTAVLFADIAGFTALTERLTQRGPAGLETLTHLLNRYFGQLIDLVTAHGGEVIKFAGDALLAFWPVANADDDLATMTLRAAQCGLDTQAHLHNAVVADGLRLSLRVSIGAGEVVMAYVGGVFNRWEFTVSGTPLVQVRVAEHYAHPGQVTLAPAVWQLIQARCTGQPLAAGHVRLDSVRLPLPLQVTPPLLLTPVMETALRGYIPAAVAARLQTEPSTWLSELRRLTVVFLNLPDVDYTMPLAQIQTVMRALQTALYRYEGSVNKLSVDDKGITLVAALGLPPLAHEDDAVRGIQAALAMQTTLQELGLRSAIGIATGQVFCGSMGNARRCEYTIIGDIVNLAARLMQAAPEDILCDTATFRAARQQVTFAALPARSMKGKAEPVPVYRPCVLVQPGHSQPRTLIGRTRERRFLAERLWALLRQGTGGLVVIDGEAGSGKTCLVDTLLHHAQTLGVSTLVGAGSALERATPYHAWRTVLRQLLQQQDSPVPAAGQGIPFLERLQADPQWGPLAPLLNIVLPLQLPENPAIATLSERLRAHKTHTLLAHILQTAAAQAPTLLLLEDAHWFDSASWALAEVVCRDVQPLLVVITTRPQAAAASSQVWLATALAHCLRLDGLSPEDTTTLVCQRLGVPTLPEPVAALIHDKAAGHPFFSEELAYALRDAGLIHTGNGACHPVPDRDMLRTLEVPDTVQKAITSRIDRLTPAQQLTLKVASVVGHVCPLPILRAIHPMGTDTEALADSLAALHHAGLLLEEKTGTEIVYRFKHVITQEAVYSLMLFAQRQHLHHAVAEWYERTYANDLAPFYPLLAQHWSKAAVISKAVDYLEKAGEQALRTHANQEAVDFFRTVLSLDLPPEVATDHLRRARWERQLGEAYYQLGQLQKSQEHLEQALALLDRPVPRPSRRQAHYAIRRPRFCRLPNARRGGWSALVRQWLLHIGQQVFPGWTLWHIPEQHALRVAEGLRIYELLCWIAYATRQSSRFLLSALTALNLAERSGFTAEAARSRAGLGQAADFLGLFGLAGFYHRGAVTLAEQVPHAPTRALAYFCLAYHEECTGAWESAMDHYQRAAMISRASEDVRAWGTATVCLSRLHTQCGNFSASLEASEELRRVGQTSGDPLLQGWGLLRQGDTRMRLGSLEPAVCSLRQAIALLQSVPDYHTIAEATGLLGQCYVRQGKITQARTVAATWEYGVPHRRATGGHKRLAEVYLAVAEQGTGTNRALALTRARRACLAAGKGGTFYLGGMPRAWRLRGTYAWLQGKTATACRWWQRSLRSAERLGTRWELAMTALEMGQRRQDITCLQQAEALFTALGATLDAAQAREWRSAVEAQSRVSGRQSAPTGVGQAALHTPEEPGYTAYGVLWYGWRAMLRGLVGSGTYCPPA